MQPFKRIGLLSRKISEKNEAVLEELIPILHQQQCFICCDKPTMKNVPSNMHSFVNTTWTMDLDLIIVVGGDGSLLHAAQDVLEHDVPLLGINRGRLGFLTDIRPESMAEKVRAILSGNYIEESRFLLQATRNQKTTMCALNDIVVSSSDYARMLSYEIYIDGRFVCSEQGDGLIVSTPTGSTAYALSAGGPIVHPKLDAMVLVSMCSHTLGNRPVVIPGSEAVCIKILKYQTSPPHVSADGMDFGEVSLDDELTISKYDKSIRLVHPEDYDYFSNVRSKLYWGR